MDLFSSADITITCQDNCVIKGTVFVPEHKLKGAVMMAPATGIKRQFYSAFASYLAEQGYGVITFDNRGIGQSLSGEVRKSNASLQCWGEQDLPAVLTQLQHMFPNTSYHLVGHSAGGQLVGLMHNCMQLSSIYNVACSSGSLRNMKMPYFAKAHFFMNIFIPLSNFFSGHTKSQLFGMGEPLPRLAAAQWRNWCNGQGYVRTAFGRSVTKHYYDELTTPSMWIRAVDDDIANEENVAEMISVFRKTTATSLTVCPSQYGLKEIGHMKFFSRKSQVLWPHVTSWLERYCD